MTPIINKLEYSDVISKLKALSNPDKAAFKAKKFNIVAVNTLGIYQADLNLLAKQIGKNSELALKLYNSTIYEAKLLCAKIYDPKDLSPALLNSWCAAFDNWEICDTYCLKLFAYYVNIAHFIPDWCNNNNEFIRRAGFATIAALCMANKHAKNEYYESFFPLAIAHANDNRIYVKKAISWALRSIGKRNKDLHALVIEQATIIQKQTSTASKWIANDILKELTSNKLRMSDYPRKLYRPKN